MPDPRTSPLRGCQNFFGGIWEFPANYFGISSELFRISSEESNDTSEESNDKSEEFFRPPEGNEKYPRKKSPNSSEEIKK